MTRSDYPVRLPPTPPAGAVSVPFLQGTPTPIPHIAPTMGRHSLPQTQYSFGSLELKLCLAKVKYPLSLALSWLNPFHSTCPTAHTWFPPNPGEENWVGNSLNYVLSIEMLSSQIRCYFPPSKKGKELPDGSLPQWLVTASTAASLGVSCIDSMSCNLCRSSSDRNSEIDTFTYYPLPNPQGGVKLN